MQKNLRNWFFKTSMALMLLLGISSYAQTNPTDVYTKVLENSELTTGYYVISAEHGSGLRVMTNANAGSFFGNESKSLTNGNFTGVTADIVWYIEKTGNQYTIYNAASQKYVAYTGSNNTAQAVNDANNDSAKWTITEQGTTDTFNVINVGTTNRILRYNPGDPRFACYKSGQTRLQLFKFQPPAITEPTLIANPTSITDLGYEYNGTQVTRSFNVTGYNLEAGDLTIASSNPNIEVSTDGTYGTTATISAYAGASATVNVRIAATAPEGAHASAITATFGALTQTVNVSGVIAPERIIPANDLCANAINLELNQPALTGTLLNSSVSAPFSGSNGDVWYTFTATYTGEHTIAVSDFSGDIDFELYAGNCPVNANSEISYAYTSNAVEVVSINLQQGQVYSVRVSAYDYSASQSEFSISLTGTVPTPTITLAGEQNIVAQVGTPVATTYTVGTIALTAGVTLSLSGDEGFSLNTTSLPVNGGEVVVTFLPTAVGTYSTTLTATSATAPTQTLVLTAQVSLQAPVATAATAVTASTFTANWNEVAGAETYSLNVYKKTGSTATVLAEGFSDATSTGGNDGRWSGNVGTTQPSNQDWPNWDFTNAYKADSCLKMGASSGKGIATTPALGEGVSGNGTLKFRAGAWESDNEKTTLIVNISGGGTLSAGSVQMQKGAFQSYELTIIGATPLTKISFEGEIASRSRFFLDDVEIVMGSTQLELVGTYTTSATSFTVEGLEDLTTYVYEVIANATQLGLPFASSSSNAIEVATLEDFSITFDQVAGPTQTCENSTVEYEFTGLNPNTDFAVYGSFAGVAFAELLEADDQGVAVLTITVNQTGNLVIESIERDDMLAPAFTINQVFEITALVNQLWYVDMDGDGYGTTQFDSILACVQPEGYAALDGDCDDNSNLVNPGMSEVLYNGIDDNCDGNLDEGFQKTTNVLDAQCGFTLNHISSPVKVYEIVGATAYRFKVENVATGLIQYVEKSDRSLYFSDLPGGGAYSSTYKVSAELQFNGVWLGYYGAECFVSTPALFAEEQGSLVVCDLQMTTISEIIRTSARAGVRTYRFKVSHYNELGEYEEELMDRPLPWFNFSTLTTAKYGTMYEVQVAVKTETGPFSDFGPACVIISPNSPLLTSCGIQVATASTLIYSETKVLGRGYRFEFTNMNTFETTVVVRPQHWLGFVHVPGYVPGTEYGVRVAVMTNGNWSPYGESCSIFAPMAAARTNSIVKAFDAVAYPSVYAEDFRLGITMTSQEKVEVAIYDMLGRSMDNRVLEAADAEYAVFGKNLPAGIYNVIVTQGAESKVVRVVKQ